MGKLPHDASEFARESRHAQLLGLDSAMPAETDDAAIDLDAILAGLAE